MKKNICIILLLIFSLSSCLAPKTPNMRPGDRTSSSSSKKVDGDLKKIVGNTSLEEELGERERIFNQISEKQEYIKNANKDLDSNIEAFLKKITDIRALIVVDLEIIASVKKGLVEEKNINKDNYIYSYIKKDANIKNTILGDLDYYRDYFKKTKEVLDDYGVNFMNNRDFINKDNLLTFNIINYYIKSGRYNRDIVKTLQSILSDIKNINKTEYEYTIKGGVVQRAYTINFTIDNIEKLIKILTTSS